MKIEEQKVFSFELEPDEKEKLREAKGVLSDLVEKIEENHCDIIVSGYCDCEYHQKLSSIYDCIGLLDDICKAWEIRRSDE